MVDLGFFARPNVKTQIAKLAMREPYEPNELMKEFQDTFPESDNQKFLNNLDHLRQCFQKALGDVGVFSHEMQAVVAQFEMVGESLAQ